MTPDELNAKLNKMSDDDFKKFVAKYGGGYEDRQRLVRDFSENPAHGERRLCYLLGLPTEEERRTKATIDSAKSAKNSSLAAAVSALIALMSLVVAVYLSHRSNRLSEEAILKNEWPWFAVTMLNVDYIDEQSYRIIGDLRHYSGGAALNVRFAIGINSEFSEQHEDNPAILPGDELKIASHKITGPKLKVGDRVSWRFSFNDVSGRCYESMQELLIRPAGGVRVLRYDTHSSECDDS